MEKVKKKVIIGFLAATVIVGGITFALYKNNKKDTAPSPTKTEAINDKVKINPDGTQAVKNEEIPVYVKYTMPLNYDDTKTTKEEKNNRQTLVNGIGDIKQGQVEFKLIKMDYKDDGTISAWGVVRNGVKDNIVDVSVNLDIKTLDGKPVANGQFNFPEREVGAVQSNTTMLVPINFKASDVVLKGQKLADVAPNNTLSYVIKTK